MPRKPQSALWWVTIGWWRCRGYRRSGSDRRGGRSRTGRGCVVLLSGARCCPDHAYQDERNNYPAQHLDQRRPGTESTPRISVWSGEPQRASDSAPTLTLLERHSRARRRWAWCRGRIPPSVGSEQPIRALLKVANCPNLRFRASPSHGGQGYSSRLVATPFRGQRCATAEVFQRLAAGTNFRCTNQSPPWSLHCAMA